MPYARNDELPKSVRDKYTSKQQRAFRKAYNDAEREDKDQETRFKVAHAAARRAGERDATQQKVGHKSGPKSEKARTFTSKQREDLAKKGQALPDGSFPVVNEQDLRNAISAYGRASNKAAAKRHIKKRARALGKTSLLPDDWREKSAMTEETFEQTRARLRAYYGYDRAPERALKLSSDNTRDALQWALRQKYEHEQGHVWVRDFHDNWVVYEREWMVGETFNDETLRRTYSITDGGEVTLGDEVEEVRPVRQTLYRPVKAFLTEVHGKTILTGPANTMLEKAMTGHPSVLWMKGRFVGAEKANRNGALWTTGDLEMGEPTVKFGPLNWLHSEKHIIGAIAETALVRPTPLQVEAAGELDQPYIAAASAIWRWIYPQESAVIEQAGEQGKLWYSMECISEKVHCGEGCGAYPYIETVKASESVCDHIKGKTTTRRFENPTFLGGAAIVPPVRPGWSDANAELVKEAASYAERAYEQAGQPDMRSSEWEQIMASVLAYAKG